MIKFEGETSNPREDLTYVILSDQKNTGEPILDQDNEDENINEEEVKIDLGSDKSDVSGVGNIEPPVDFSKSNTQTTVTKKLLSALFYGTCSFLITVINKIVLTTYQFPSSNILGLGQMVSIIVILAVSNMFKVVTIRRNTIRNKNTWILSSIYLCNLITGLGSTKYLPLPMFIALRRFSIALTALGEFYVLRVRQSYPIILTIAAMIGGSFIAALTDLAFHAIGYLLVTLSNLSTAANNVFTKKIINSQSVNKHEILFYNAFFAIIPMFIISVYVGGFDKLHQFEHWSSIGFIMSFITSCVMGYLLMFSTILCTQYNSPLTTTIVGTLKNILTTYVGMYIGGDYKFSVLNFIGLNISLIGSLVYSYLTFIAKEKPKSSGSVRI